VRLQRDILTRQPVGSSRGRGRGRQCLSCLACVGVWRKFSRAAKRGITGFTLALTHRLSTDTQCAGFRHQRSPSPLHALHASRSHGANATLLVLLCGPRTPRRWRLQPSDVARIEKRQRTSAACTQIPSSSHPARRKASLAVQFRAVAALACVRYFASVMAVIVVQWKRNEASGATQHSPRAARLGLGPPGVSFWGA
jgi:hypothetical protein